MADLKLTAPATFILYVMRFCVVGILKIAEFFSEIFDMVYKEAFFPSYWLPRPLVANDQQVTDQQAAIVEEANEDEGIFEDEDEDEEIFDDADEDEGMFEGANDDEGMLEEAFP